MELHYKETITYDKTIWESSVYIDNYRRIYSGFGDTKDEALLNLLSMIVD